MRVKIKDFNPGDLVKRAVHGIEKKGNGAQTVYVCDVVCGEPEEREGEIFIPVLSRKKEYGGVGFVLASCIHHSVSRANFPKFFLEESKRLRLKYGVTDEAL